MRTMPAPMSRSAAKDCKKTAKRSWRGVDASLVCTVAIYTAFTKPESIYAGEFHLVITRCSCSKPKVEIVAGESAKYRA